MNAQNEPTTLFQRAKPLMKWGLKLALAGAIIFWLVHQQSGEIPFDRIADIGPAYITVILVLFFLVHCSAAWRWQVFLKYVGIRLSVWGAITANAQSIFYGLALPAGAMAGDVIKITMIARALEKGKRMDAAGTVLIDRIIGMMSLFTLVLLLCPYALMHWETCTKEAQILLLIIVPLCAAGLLCGIGVFMHRFFAQWPGIRQLINFVNRISKGKVEELFCVLDTFTHHKKHLTLFTIFGMFFIHLPAAFILMIIMHCFGLEISFWPVVFSAMAGNVAAVIPASFAGLGLREATIYFLLCSLGPYANQTEVINLSVLIYGLATLAQSAMLGGFLFGSFSLRRRRAQKTQKISTTEEK